jgi:hypothetical protein
MGEKEYCVYILTNSRRTVLYTGVTNNLERRIYEHKNKIGVYLPRNTMLMGWFIMRNLAILISPSSEKSKSKQAQDKVRWI